MSLAGDRIRSDRHVAGLRSHGLSERLVAIERDQWLLLSAHAPDHVREWVSQKAAWLDNTQFVDLYRAVDHAFGWGSGDPWLERLADELLDLFGQQYPETAVDAGIGDTVAALLDTQTTGASPGWRHLAALLEKHRSAGHTAASDPSRYTS